MTRHSWTVVVALLLASAPAFAELPLATLIESSAGRFIFGASPRGTEILNRMVGTEISGSERFTALNLVLDQPEMNQAARQLSTRLNRIHDRFSERFPNNAEAFVAGGHILSAEESAFLRQLAVQELDRAFIRFLPEHRLSEASYSATREAFLAGREARIAEIAARNLAPLPKLQAWAAEGVTSDAVAAFQEFENQIAHHPELAQWLPKKNVYRMLVNEEMTGYTQRFKGVMQKLAADTTDVSTHEKLARAIREELADKVPAKSIPSRIKALSTGTTTALERAMGDMTLKESQLLLHGGNPLAPTADSLLGKYIAETGAATVVRTFSKGGPTAVAGDGEGPARLVVAVSPETQAVWIKYFGKENLLGHLHTRGQGTLMLTYKGKTGSYAHMNQEIRLSEGTIIPTIVLKSTEGQRAAQFFKFGDTQGNMIAQQPWHIAVPAPAVEGQAAAPNLTYCAISGYNSCTHWFGNIPIGDKLVTEYKFPGMVDGYAYNQVPPTADPRIQKLRPYPSNDPLMQRVWKVPGNQQLGATLGLEAQSLAGELANPGWVARSLTGAASTDRVPVVFVVQPDVRAPINPTFDPQISNY